MKSLRNSKVLAVFGVLSVMLAVAVLAAPSADAGCGGYGYGYSSYYAPVHTHYVAPAYPTYNYVAPVYHNSYYTPTYFGHGCHYGW
jgi:hypothetical protein